VDNRAGGNSIGGAQDRVNVLIEILHIHNDAQSGDPTPA
jgi:hypothetical protein